MPTYPSPVTSLPTTVVEHLLYSALCCGDSDDADRATIELYLLLLEEMERDLAGDEDAPCLVVTLMFAMARRFLAGPSTTPAAAALAVPHFFQPTRFAA
jgi:hypothetical protein